ncbi:MAG: D-aminoacylase [Gammaproteobacteria bacterium]|nr:D-aminoacylase [Gammaproteobacteria bacterium]
MDTIFKNATVIDGSGGERFIADVAVSESRIIAIEANLNTEGKQTVDASDKVLCPGFIDAHTHDDRAVLAYPDMTAKVSQGVTTVITGNCGISIAPLADKTPVPPLNLLGEQREWIFPDFDSYAEALDKSPAAVNSVMLTGHSTLRVGAMEALDKPANRAELDLMCKRLDQNLAAGSAGLSTGLAYPPATNAPPAEVVELVAVLKDHKGIYTTHMRDEENGVIESVEETLQVCFETNVPTVISHHKACGKANWGKTSDTLPLIAKARESHPVSCDVYPYTASSTVLLMDFVKRSERVMITWSRSYPEFQTWDLDDIVKEMGCDLASAVDRLQPAGAIYFQMSDADLENVLSFEGAMIGSDGLPHDVHPHPRLWGTFPRVIGHYSRDRKLFSLENAIHRMTGATAKNFNIQQRGLIKAGYHADLVLFDPDTIIDCATYENPELPSMGIDSVMVNGAFTLSQKQTTEARPGQLLV